MFKFQHINSNKIKKQKNGHKKPSKIHMCDQARFVLLCEQQTNCKFTQTNLLSKGKKGWKQLKGITNYKQIYK